MTLMDRLEIQYRMKRAGVTQAAIAEKLGIKPPTVCNVIKGTATSARVKTAIAKALGLSVDEIWPSNRAA